MVFGTVTKLTKTKQNISIGSKNMDWVRSFVSGLNRCIVSFPAQIGALKQPRHGFRRSNEADQNEPKHQYWVQNVDWVRSFVSGPNWCIVSFPPRIGALKQPRHGFRHSNETDQNEPKHHYWVQKRGLGAFIRFWTESVHRFVSGPNRCIKATPTWFSAR